MKTRMFEGLLLGALLGIGAHPARAQQAGLPTIVLVHGAFADASGWSEVITRLQKRGYSVIAVQNALASLASDVANTRRVIDAQPGNVVAVGHSYGGSVISGAAAGSARVKALVYIAAFGPEANESIASVGQKFAPPALASSLVPDAAGFLSIDTAKFRDAFAADLSADRTRVLAATQKPIAAGAFEQSNPAAAWKTVPSWYLVARDDRSINPDAQRFYAARMKATTQEVDAAHLPFLSRPDAVVRMILAAAEASRTSNIR